MSANLLEEVILGKEKPTIQHFTDPLAIIIGSFGGGYAVANFPPEFLKKLYSPIGQVIIFYIVIYLTYKDDPTVTWQEMLLEAIIYAIIVQTANLILNWIYR